MATLHIPSGLLSPSDERAVCSAIDKAVETKKRNGCISLSKFKDIIRSACSWLWDKIKDFVAMWYALF